MSVRIITDSASDIGQAEGQALGVTVMPLKIMIDGQEYSDGVDISNEQLYERLKSADRLPTTAQPSSGDFKRLFDEAQEDEIVAVLLASGLSGTVQSATIASGETEGKHIFIVDSETASLAERLLVMRAVQLRDQGLDGASIAAALEREREDIVLLAVVDTLKYLHKGGRLSGVEAVAGGLLGVKPIITIKKGALSVLGKERGKGRAYKFVKDTAFGMGELDTSRQHSLGFTADEEAIAPFRQVMGPEYDNEDAIVDSIGGVIGIHAGPGAVALAYFRKG